LNSRGRAAHAAPFHLAARLHLRAVAHIDDDRLARGDGAAIFRHDRRHDPRGGQHVFHRVGISSPPPNQHCGSGAPAGAAAGKSM
jgi:hypothetical protein